MNFEICFTEVKSISKYFFIITIDKAKYAWYVIGVLFVIVHL